MDREKTHSKLFCRGEGRNRGFSQSVRKKKNGAGTRSETKKGKK